MWTQEGAKWNLLKQTQTGYQEMKNTKFKIKYMTTEINNWLETTHKQFSELEYIAIELFKMKYKECEKLNWVSMNCEPISMGLKYM